MKNKYYIAFYALASLSALFFAANIFFSCGTDKVQDKKEIAGTAASSWLNHSDTARYVGKETCKKCHQAIYNSFLQTGMGSSIGPATKAKSAADFSHALIYDKFSDFYYKAFWKNDTFRILEFRLKGKDTVHKRLEKVDFIVGSGQHTNSHLQMVNGYINQAPMTFYTQKKKWDLPPGFENGHNSRFSRLIGLECMSCHNAYPGFETGSENKFTAVPDGIDCERCHGPGSVHVALKSNGDLADTSKEIDYSIVNPAKLPVERQFDICMRCHLQGNAVLAEGKSWYDFRPGMKLSDYITVFLPKYKNADDEFIMASHADRLRQSRCFIVSLDKAKNKEASLRPYKDALTCVSCHNPHVSVKQTSGEHFNSVCSSCHGAEKNKSCSADDQLLKKNNFNCVSCHMPVSGSQDIPHVSIHDHYIRRPMQRQEVNKIREFIGLYAINDKRPDSLTVAKAYINQYEKFEWKAQYLDSAEKYLGGRGRGINKNLETYIRLLFIRNDFSSVRKAALAAGADKLLKNVLVNKTPENDHAWTCYRIGEAFYEGGDFKTAELFYSRACELAPWYPDFRTKYGAAVMMNGNVGEARKIFTAALIENPRYVSALTNLGYLDAYEGNLAAAEENYSKAYRLDPDYVPLLTNMGGLKLHQGKYEEGMELLVAALKKDPARRAAAQIIFGVASNLAMQKKFPESENLIKKFLSHFPADKEALSLMKEIAKKKNG